MVQKIRSSLSSKTVLGFYKLMIYLADTTCCLLSCFAPRRWWALWRPAAGSVCSRWRPQALPCVRPAWWRLRQGRAALVSPSPGAILDLRPALSFLYTSRRITMVFPWHSTIYTPTEHYIIKTITNNTLQLFSHNWKTLSDFR